MRRPTLHDVAAEAKVSIKTVSRVVNGEDNVSAGVRERVQVAVDKLHYVPNTLARSLKVGLGDTIGVVMDSIADPFFASLTSAVEATALEAGLNVVFGSTGFDHGREREQVDRMVMQQVRGLVLAPVRGDHGYLTRYRERVPTVCVDRSIEIEGYDTVVVDDYGATRHGVEHLIAHGHRRIAFVGGNDRYDTINQRMVGYRDCLEDAGIGVEERLVSHDDAETAQAEDAVLRMLEDNPDVTAVFSANTRASLGVVHGLHRARRTDVAMVSFGDFLLAETLEPGVTAIDHDPVAIGEVATAHLLARLGLGDGPPVPPSQAGERVVVPTRLIERGSGEIEVAR
ncbi:MAG: LacI family DNA-binding transcriptional regulator [Nocardioidaceae bacterium]|nr:LacI family DNA-binding transcriptional regulator [Nocardioidaceae bacterium]NUS50877.1 LacI family DNA-binding transcriptional regulator [Nocardioidaceae bacterium]